jgi:hypothetical protein
MKDTLNISRNHFIKGIVGAGVLSFFPSVSKSNDKPQFSQQRLINNLIKVLNEQNAYYGDQLDTTQISNIKYAVAQIKPSTHQELAFVVACGDQRQSSMPIVDEYIRRKNWKTLTLPDHPVLALKGFGLPNTQRILIYREQVEALIEDLTNLGRPSSKFFSLENKLRLAEHFSGKFVYNKLVEELNEYYQKRLSDNEIEIIYQALVFYIKIKRPYVWCSTMATRASLLS